MRLLLPVVALAVLAAGGGEAGRTTEPAAPLRASDSTVVTLTNTLTYVPDTVRIAAGATVVWHNTSLLVHTVTDDPSQATIPGSAQLPTKAEPFDSGNLAPGARYSHTFVQPGTYGYFCIPHEAAKMRGVVIVR